MKRFLCLAIVSVLFFWIGSAYAGTKTINFAWQQDVADLSTLTGWKIYKADVAGGPYALLSTINYNGAPQQEYTSGPQSLISPDGQIKTYFFVATAFKPGAESGYSNEVSAVIDFKAISVPVQFRLTVTTP